ncbi:hypothetical protein AVCANL279_08845 [Campylobacter canadensis]|nr:hypothetical protein [Campylobacter canadensis]MBZ7997414.1 hypothetical protein [Campylobacter canadensis]MBZ8004608.1 hypothetical protein [Campylobacter canadensis]
MKIMANSYTMYQTTNVSKKETNNEIKKVDDKKIGEVLGYGVDKDGFFTSDFNKAAGIPEDFKIHSDSLKNLVDRNNNSLRVYRKYYEIDIAKTVNNAYTLFSQIVSEDFLNSKEFFNTEDIKQFPQGYVIKKGTFEVTKILQSPYEFSNANFDKRTEDVGGMFFHYRNEDKTKPNTVVFRSKEILEEDKLHISNFDPAEDRYKNEKGEFTKGGLLMGFLSSDIRAVIEAETTYDGKFSGYDRNINRQDFHAFDMALGAQLISRGENGFTSAEVERMPRWLKDYVKFNRFDKSLKERSAFSSYDTYSKLMFSPIKDGDFEGKNITSTLAGNNNLILTPEQIKAEREALEKFMKKIRELMGIENHSKASNIMSFEDLLKLAFSFSQKNISLFDMKV